MTLFESWLPKLGPALFNEVLVSGRHLDPAQRRQFLNAVAVHLENLACPTDGEVRTIIREMLAEVRQ